MREAAGDDPWMLRMIAMSVAFFLAVVVVGWLQQDDVFVVYRKNCPPRAGTFWPLLIAWVAGAACLRLLLYPPMQRHHQGIDDARPTAGMAKRPHPMTWIFLGAFAVWTVACATVLVNNVNRDVVWASVSGAGAALTGVLLMVLLVGLLVGARVLWAWVTGDRRGNGLQGTHQGLGDVRRREVLDHIDRYARADEPVLLYRAADAGERPDAAMLPGSSPDPSGVTLAVPAQARFLIQLPLAGSRLPPVWHRRALAVHLAGGRVVVESHAVDPEVAALRCVRKGGRDGIEPLQALAIPYRADAAHADELQDPLAIQLLKGVPGLSDLLVGQEVSPERLLRSILAGGAGARERYAQVGGDPGLSRAPQPPSCPECGGAMRFLCRFDDPTHDFAMADLDVAYVYGCDAHPAQCEALVNCY